MLVFEEIELSKEEFDSLHEYSLTVPTVSGKSGIAKWKRHHEGKWYLGEYDFLNQKTVGKRVDTPIIWKQIRFPSVYTVEFKHTTVTAYTATVPAFDAESAKESLTQGPFEYLEEEDQKGYHEQGINWEIISVNKKGDQNGK